MTPSPHYCLYSAWTCPAQINRQSFGRLAKIWPHFWAADRQEYQSLVICITVFLHWLVSTPFHPHHWEGPHLPHHGRGECPGPWTIYGSDLLDSHGLDRLIHSRKYWENRHLWEGGVCMGLVVVKKGLMSSATPIEVFIRGLFPPTWTN